MKKHTIFLAILLFSLTLFAQEIQHEAVAVNIEVPVRVFKGKTFIDNLTIKDFEIYEDGVLQKTEAVYLIKKLDIVREDTEMDKEEARKIFAPHVSRNFVFLFEIHEYFPKIGKAIEYFFNDVYVPGDSLMVLTPLQTYHFKNVAIEQVTKKEMAKELIVQLRLDIRRSIIEYRNLLRDLESIETLEREFWPEPDWDAIVRRKHSDISTRLGNLRFMDENKLLEFVDVLKETKGPKHIFFFLQNLNISIKKDNPVYGFDDLEEFEDFMALDKAKIKRIFSDSSISAHMIYITKISDLAITGRERGGAVLTNTDEFDTSQTTIPREIMEISGDIFNAFKDIAEATGGIADRSTNAAASFKKSVEASENYYLLYYSPKNYTANGKFKEITIKVKGQNYKISHRAGYIAE